MFEQSDLVEDKKIAGSNSFSQNSKSLRAQVSGVVAYPHVAGLYPSSHTHQSLAHALGPLGRSGPARGKVRPRPESNGVWNTRGSRSLRGLASRARNRRRPPPGPRCAPWAPGPPPPAGEMLRRWQPPRAVVAAAVAACTCPPGLNQISPHDRLQTERKEEGARLARVGWVGGGRGREKASGR